jgi:hypothetical protein
MLPVRVKKFVSPGPARLLPSQRQHLADSNARAALAERGQAVKLTLAPGARHGVLQACGACSGGKSISLLAQRERVARKYRPAVLEQHVDANPLAQELEDEIDTNLAEN